MEYYRGRLGREARARIWIQSDLAGSVRSQEVLGEVQLAKNRNDCSRSPVQPLAAQVAQYSWAVQEF